MENQKMIPQPVSMSVEMKARIIQEVGREIERTGKRVSFSEIVRRAVDLYLSIRTFDSIAEWCAAQPTMKGQS